MGGIFLFSWVLNLAKFPLSLIFAKISTVNFLYVGISVSVPYPVRFFCESVAGGRVKQFPWTLQQLEALATS